MLDVNIKIGDKLTYSPAVFHATYAGLLVAWTKCRDAYAGGLAIKAAGEKYLSRLSGHEEHEKAGISQTEADKMYADYKARA